VGDSLREQLLKAGLVDKSRLQQVNKQQAKQARQQRNVRQEPVTPEQQQQQREQAAKAARDRELNQQHNEARRQRELAIQLGQLIARHKLPRASDEEDRPFYFQNKGKIKRIYVSARNHQLISNGELAIVNHNGVFELVPAAIADKIRERNPSLVIELPKETSPGQDDPYAAYQVPDDLMW